MQKTRSRRTHGWLQHVLPGDMGIDLGTANTVVYVPGRGVVLNEPSVIAFEPDRRTVVAVGGEAKRMIGRTPDRIAPVRPLRGGAIADFRVTLEMLRRFIQRAWHGAAPLRPRVVVTVPSGATDVERRAFREAALQIGVHRIGLIEEPLAAAIGAGLPVDEPAGSMVVDIGGGRTEVAVLSMGGVVAHRSIPVAGDVLDEGIAGWIKRRYNVLVGEGSAEAVKIAVGSAVPAVDDRRTVIHGRDLTTGLPCELELTASEVGEALAEPIDRILEVILETLEATGPELGADLMDRGIVLTGGGALLAGLERAVAGRTGLPATVADEPLLCVARGAGHVLTEPAMLRRLATAVF